MAGVPENCPLALVGRFPSLINGAEGPGGCLRRIGELGKGGGQIFLFGPRNVRQDGPFSDLNAPLPRMP